MKFTLSAMTAGLATVTVAFPRQITHTDVEKLNIPPQSPELLAAFNALSKTILPAERAGNVPINPLQPRTLIARANVVLYITMDPNWTGRNEPLESAPGQCWTPAAQGISSLTFAFQELLTWMQLGGEIKLAPTDASILEQIQ
ncbi:hypothetical protein HYFRA_00012867 [Hymenoscyphus fraxineus]|uniref:Uncharacterized protein n=1 Tax=Hymenoscyphus fraxineus TaxID=746836 RepID=A0A9N9L5U0_9HELO|nr:hypothetical protein HYFRA_00012867 [Hymenoscyphus fraxineus]